jgi:hypothetical protein
MSAESARISTGCNVARQAFSSFPGDRDRWGTWAAAGVAAAETAARATAIRIWR